MDDSSSQQPPVRPFYKVSNCKRYYFRCTHGCFLNCVGDSNCLGDRVPVDDNCSKYCFYTVCLFIYVYLEMELKEEYDENEYGSMSRGSSGALQKSNAQNLPGISFYFDF